MLGLLDSYALLLLVPMMCVPVQRLFLKSGQRYDLGAVTYIAGGTFIAAAASVHVNRGIAHSVLVAILATILGVFAIRVLALAVGRPADFTLISFGQLWATPALIDYELQKLTQSSGLPLEPVHLHPAVVAFVVSGLAAVLGFAIARSSLPHRLTALTESPVQYRLLCGSPLGLALRLEALALFTYLLAGTLLGLLLNDLSADSFGNESIWCVLAAAPAARSSGALVLAAPFSAILARFLIKSLVPSRFATMAVYATLVFFLAVVISRAPEASRDATA